jgi:RNA polymerase sigma-70 factor (ECF subfamily)
VSLRDTGSPPLAWLYTVAKRRFADEARRRSRLELHGEETLPEYGAEAGLAISDALAALPEGQRQVVVLKLLRGARFVEIAQLLEVTEAAAKMRFVRALEALRVELERKGVTP